MSTKIKKYESGCEKRKKKRRIEELTQSQRGALDKFFVKQSHNSGSNANMDSNVNVEIVDNGDVDFVPIENEFENEIPSIEKIVAEDGDGPDGNNDNVVEDDEKNGDHVLRDNEMRDEPGCRNAFNLDIFDPRNWDALSPKMIDALVEQGLKRDMSIKDFPRDKYNKCFAYSFYTRKLPNGEKCDRDWLVYSKELDRVFCFCCKVFSTTYAIRGGLAIEGFCSWIHLSRSLKEHEKSADHIKNMATWYELRLRLKTTQTIDNVNQRQIRKEKDHWSQLLVRIISIVKFLGKYNLPFRGTNERLYEDNNGIFLGVAEMCAEFDPIMKEHLHRIMNGEIHFHYLGHRIQNELILLLASRIKSEIISKIKKAKYFSVILDCTPDSSQQEQMSMILRYVDVSSKSVAVEESFLGFLNVDVTTGQGLFDVLESELKNLDLDIHNVRGQGYDNGSNMKGKHQGVQKKMLDVNPRAYYMPCGCHSLNLMLCDMANTCGQAIEFFGVIQRIYTIFAKSPKRWHILLDNVKGLTLKSLSATRWESRIESVKPIRFQISDVRKALLELAQQDGDPKIKSEGKSLVKNELGDFEFLVSIVIWYEILFHVNLVSKGLQSKDMVIDVAIKQMKGLVAFFEKFRENGFEPAVEEA